MNKPEWKDAPKWAQWLAQDADGNWNWHSAGYWCLEGRSGRYTEASDDLSNPNWRDTLERRPKAGDALDVAIELSKECRRLVEALRPLARAAEQNETGEFTLVKLVDAFAARALLIELGEWPEAALPPVQNNLEAGKPGC